MEASCISAETMKCVVVRMVRYVDFLFPSSSFKRIYSESRGQAARFFVCEIMQYMDDPVHKEPCQLRRLSPQAACAGSFGDSHNPSESKESASDLPSEALSLFGIH